MRKVTCNRIKIILNLLNSKTLVAIEALFVEIAGVARAGAVAKLTAAVMFMLLVVVALAAVLVHLPQKLVQIVEHLAVS